MTYGIQSAGGPGSLCVAGSRAHARIIAAAGVVLVVASVIAFTANRDNDLAEIPNTPTVDSGVPAQDSPRHLSSSNRRTAKTVQRENPQVGIDRRACRGVDRMR